MADAENMIKSCNYTIWYHILLLIRKNKPESKCPSWLKGKTGMVIKYSDKKVTKVKLS